jgi:hypothetical protein
MILGEPEWIKLGEALRRYDVAIGYTEPQSGFIAKSHGAGLLHNAIRVEMSDCLTKFGASGQVRFKGASNREPLLTAIPTEYFREARTFTFENKIVPYADEQTTEDWADSRNNGIRHPTWINVLVHRISFGEWLKGVYSECLRPSTSDPANLPDQQSLTLAETTSFLAFGHALEGSQIADWCDPCFKERIGLIERCSIEAEGKPELSHWPSNLAPDAKRLALALFDEYTPKPWPSSGEKLHQLAIAQSYSDESNDLRIAVAEALIHNWAYNGKLKITGVKESFTAHEEIDHRSFATRYELDWWFGNSISPSLFEKDGRFTWSKVFVERSSLASMIEKYKVPDVDSEIEIASFAKETRWGLVPTLIWIATRDLALAARAAKPGTTFQGADIGLSVRKASFKLNGTERQWPHESLKDAWKKELAVRMSEGTLKAFANCVSSNWDGGYSQNTPGVLFPPLNTPGAALDHFIDDGNSGPFLRPNGSQGAHSWTEWQNVSFGRTDILRIWPVLEVAAALAEQAATIQMDKAQLEAAYIQRRDNWSNKERTSSLEEDWAFLKTLHPGLPRRRATEMRATHAPDTWKKSGRRSNS